MPDSGGRLESVLDGFAKFFSDKDLALPREQPYLGRWVREFLSLAREHAGYTFEQALDLFLAEVGGRVVRKPRSRTRRAGPAEPGMGAVLIV